MPEWKLKHATRKGTPTSASLKIKNDKNKLKGLTMASRVKKAGRGSDPKTQASEADRDYKNDNPIDTDAEDIAIGVSQSLDTNNSSEPRSARERKLGKKARLEQQLKKAKLDKLNEKNPKDNNVRLGGENGGRDLQNFAWEKAQKLSIGEKVRDDPALLTKALKKYKGKKEASARKWKVRIEDVQKRMKDRQKKKRQNLEERRKLRRKRGKH